MQQFVITCIGNRLGNKLIHEYNVEVKVAAASESDAICKESGTGQRWRVRLSGVEN